ncbi:uncharacterized protein LOC111242520 isoform X1 [Vigna radiata var. radiata]|uniref:Uncharacterized protein LOC111242520 isoform X1 n=1 Tax=Vigna radiata var. radiata TaxID=3916 RepID=A0A3Q0FGQ0_VIGRR|nr:uncharacterized protein LOC111242520 isoform X1 [Vigna radiata var. radiata]
MIATVSGHCESRPEIPTTALTTTMSSAAHALAPLFLHRVNGRYRQLCPSPGSLTASRQLSSTVTVTPNLPFNQTAHYRVTPCFTETPFPTWLRVLAIHGTLFWLLVGLGFMQEEGYSVNRSRMYMGDCSVALETNISGRKVGCTW